MSLFSRKPVDVLVAGAGPVGLYAAVQLARQGAHVVVAERAKCTKLHSHALALHSSVIQQFEDQSFVQRLIEKGHRIGKVAYYDGPDRKAELDLTQLGSEPGFVLVLPQSELEYELLKELSNVGARPSWNHELIELHESPANVSVELAQIEDVSQGYPIMGSHRMRGRSSIVQAKFVIGADGYHSIVRRLIRARFTKLSEPSHFVVFEFFSESGIDDEVRVVLDDCSTNVLWPMGAHRYRWTLEIKTGHAPASDKEVLRIIRARAPWFESDPGESTWLARVEFDQRITDPLGTERVWLVGDAAHSTTPLGAQSMNAGLLESHELVDAILSQLRTGSAHADFQGYQTNTHLNWQKLHGREPINRGTWVNSWVEKNWQRILSTVPATGHDFDQLMMQLRK